MSIKVTGEHRSNVHTRRLTLVELVIAGSVVIIGAFIGVA